MNEEEVEEEEKRGHHLKNLIEIFESSTWEVHFLQFVLCNWVERLCFTWGSSIQWWGIEREREPLHSTVYYWIDGLPRSGLQRHFLQATSTPHSCIVPKPNSHNELPTSTTASCSYNVIISSKELRHSADAFREQIAIAIVSFSFMRFLSSGSERAEREFTLCFCA
jgi:hypothetical protein